MSDPLSPVVASLMGIPSPSASSSIRLPGIRVRPFFNGKNHSYQGPLTRFSTDFGHTPEQQDAFPNPDEAKRLGVENPSF
ncbi:MAG TPA: hypothetical protein VFB91_07815, partial [Terriglobales bacterium]|nr:hypothetical protein [Terriglobales bacterium]